MKNILLILLLLLILNVNAQWVNKIVDNDFDEPYRICYTATNNNGYLKLENIDGSISFYIKGGYYCDDSPVVDLSFVVKGVTKKYSINATTSESNDIVWLIDDLTNSQFIEDFKNCSILKVRVNDYTCSSKIYSFNMSGSSSAIKFISYKKKIDNPIFIEEEIIEFPDVEAEFKGGAQAMMKFIEENILYPPKSIEMNEQGKVYLSFIVELDGSISNVAVERGVSKDIDAEAKRVVRAMPKWTPGEAKGKKCRTRCRLPINFQLG